MRKAEFDVLFLCAGNACRSQMCEGWARHLKGDRIKAWSAGVAPHGLDPRAVLVMAEEGVVVRFTVLLRPHVSTLTDRYSERKEAAGPERDPAHDLSAIATAREPKMAQR